MAGEITTTGSIIYKAGNISFTRSVVNVKSDQANQGMQYGIQTIGLVKTALNMGSITTSGMTFFRNMSITDALEIGRDIAGAFEPFLELRKNEWQILRLKTNAPFALALVAPLNLEYLILEA